MAAAVASRGAMRVGYATRSTTGAGTQQVMNGARLFANGPTGTNGNANGTIRKKRRRYGPKPEPPYTCFCGKVFKRHEHMLRHRATHDDSIKYECHICGKCFRRQDVMHRHTMTHTSRSRLQSKMRTTASTLASSSGNANHSSANRREVDEGQMGGGVRKRDPSYDMHHGQHHLSGQAGMNQSEMLEDPLLRVGLSEYPTTPTSVRHNEDHQIAAAQLYSACNQPRYSYPCYPVNVQVGEMGEGPHARWVEPGLAADYHSRMGSSSLSPPPSFFPSPAAGFAPVAFEPGHLGGVQLARPHFGMSTLPPVVEYETKVHAGHDAAAYAQSWHGGYSFTPHGGVHMGASESEWSEQSPSGPSTHTFASPAWSQKAELMRREGAGSLNGTPSGLSNRQLSMDLAGARWQQHQQPEYQHGSPLLNGSGEAGHPTLHRSPNHEPRRRLSMMHVHDNYADGAGSNGHATASKPEPHNEAGVVGLGLFDQSHGNTCGPIGIVPMSTISNCNSTSSGMHGNGDRLAAMHHSSPHAANGNLLPSPSHYLGAGMNSMHVSEHRSWSYPPDGKHGLHSVMNASETFDTGSPLTEVTGNASPGIYARASSGGADRELRSQENMEGRDGEPIDPHLKESSKGYTSSTLTVGGDGDGRRGSRHSW